MTNPTHNPDAPFTVTNSRIAWECPWYAVRQDDLRLPDGTAYTYNVVTKCDAVWVLPITTDGHVVLIRTYRHTIGQWAWEIPAGGIEHGHTPLAAARQELAEEIGGTTEDWHFLMKISTSNGLCDEHAHIYLASGVTLGETHHEPMEFITIHPTPPDEALAMARRGEINDATSVLALFLAREQGLLASAGS